MKWEYLFFMSLCAHAQHVDVYNWAFYIEKLFYETRTQKNNLEIVKIRFFFFILNNQNCF